MAESDGEIEYLDEDADIVQQCVQNVSIPELPELAIPEPVPEISENENVIKPMVSPLLVERTRSTRANRKRKRPPKLEEEDSDYDPREDVATPTSNTSSKKKKKKPSSNKKAKLTPISHSTSRQMLVRNATSANKKPPKSTPHQASVKTVKSARKRKPDQLVVHNAPKKPKSADEMILRKKMEIIIPDYEDALCLPVRAIKNDEDDAKKLKSWNYACLEHLRTFDIILRPESGKTVSSTRHVTLKNVANPETKKIDTSISSRIWVENEEGVKKSQNFYSVLPKYREKNELDVSHLTVVKKPMVKRIHHVNEAIITKECTKNEDSLVIYKPREATSAVYKLMAKDSDVNADEQSSRSPQRKLRMTEVACCKMCAPCYQASWRGLRKADQKRSLACPVCSRSSVSVYNLLTHVRSHAARLVRDKRREISAALKQVVDYHYKCRICTEDFSSIKELRHHVATHRGEDSFLCEIGNHMAS